MGAILPSMPHRNKGVPPARSRSSRTLSPLQSQNPKAYDGPRCGMWRWETSEETSEGNHYLHWLQ